MRDDSQEIFDKQADLWASDERIKREEEDKALGLPEENISRASEVNEHNCKGCNQPFFVYGRENQAWGLCPMCVVKFINQKHITKEVFDEEHIAKAPQDTGGNRTHGEGRTQYVSKLRLPI